MSVIFAFIAIVAVVYAVRCRSKMKYARQQIAEAQMYLAEAIEDMEAGTIE